jgi:hypothetical protein
VLACHGLWCNAQNDRGVAATDYSKFQRPRWFSVLNIKIFISKACNKC